MAWACLAAGCLAMATVTRYTNLIFALVPIVALLAGWRRAKAERAAPSRGRGAFLLATGGLVVVALAVAAQLRALRPTVTPPEVVVTAPAVKGRSAAADPERPSLAAAAGYYGHERFHWTRPALVRSLLSSRNGLLFYSPGIAVAVLFALRRWREPIVLGLLLSAGALWYVNAAWWAWWFGPNSFGNRAYLELAPLVILGFGVMIDTLAPRRRGLLALLVVAALATTVMFLLLVRANVVVPGEPLLPFEQGSDTSDGARF